MNNSRRDTSRTMRSMPRRGGMGHGRGPAEKPANFKGTWKKLIKYCRKYVFAMVIALICAAIGTVFTLIGPDMLSDLTDTITQGIKPNSEKLEDITKAIGDNFGTNFAAVYKKTIENISDPVKFVSGGELVRSSSRLSQADKDSYEQTLAAFGTAGTAEEKMKLIASLPAPVMDILYGNMTVNDVTLTADDQKSILDAAETMAALTNDGKSAGASTPSFTPNVLNVLYTDAEVDGKLITGEEQIKLLELMKKLDTTDMNKAMQQMKSMPDSVKELIGQRIDMKKITRISVFLLAIYLLSYLLSASQGFIMASVTQNVSKKMRSDISHKINRLPMSYYSKTTTGDILSRTTNDVDMIGQSLNQSIGTLLTSVVLLFGSLFMMFKTNLWLTLTAIGASIIGFVFMFVVMGKSQKYFTRQQKHLGEINGHIEEIFSGQTVVKAYNGEENARTEFDRMNSDLKDSSFKAQCLSGMMMPMMGFIGNLGYVAVCIVGGMLALDGQIGFGTIVAFMIYVRYFTQPLSQIAQAMQSLQSAAAAGERVFEFLEAKEMEDESAKTAALKDVKGEVEFSHVKFGYDADKPVIKDFSVKVKPGQKIAIVGPTGAGKTTLVNLLMRFYEIQSGEIKIDGTSTQSVTREDVHSQFCMVLQDTWLYEGTVRENLVYCTENVPDEKLKSACKAVGLYHFIKTLPNGFDTCLNDNVSLSQGQKQQLTIARAMIADKPMLILDEATSSVDTRTELKIQQAMDELMKDRTSFVIAHRLSTIKNADLILVLKDGDVVESGNHNELMARNGAYAELYNSQFDRATA